MNMQGKRQSYCQEHAHPIREERQARDQPCSGLVLRGRGPLHLPPAQGHPHRRRALHRREQDQVWQVLVIKIVSSDFKAIFFQVFLATNHLPLPDKHEPPAVGDQRLRQLHHLLQLCHQVKIHTRVHCILNKLVAQRAEKISGKILPSPGSRAASGTL